MNKCINTLAFVITALALLSFTRLSPDAITVTSMRERYLNYLFELGGNSQDTSVFIIRKNYLDKPTKAYPISQCGLSPAYTIWKFYNGLDTVYSNQGPDNFRPEVLTRFRSLFGHDIIKSRIKMAVKDWNGNPLYWNHYNAIALKAAFDKLYQRPTGNFEGAALQKIYDASLKDYVRNMTNVVVKVMANKPAFEAQATQYQVKSTTDPEFEGLNFCSAATVTLNANLSQDCLGDYDERVVGIMLRRQCDGSLPTLLICLKTMLKDYDLEYYNKVNPKF